MKIFLKYKIHYVLCLLGMLAFLFGCDLATTTSSSTVVGINNKNINSDNQKIAFLRFTEGFWQVWLMNTDGSEQVPLTMTTVDKLHMAWSPDNQELLYHTNQGKTYIINIVTGEQRQIFKDLKLIDVAWHQDGKTFAFGLSPEDLVRGKTSLWVSDLTGQGKMQLAGDTKSDASAPMWTADGTQMLYRQCFMATNMQVYHDFWLMDNQGQNKTMIEGESSMLKFDQVISSKGMVAYSSAGSGFYEIWVIPYEGGKPHQLTDFKAYSGNPFWSPDGKVLVFDSDKTGMMQIYRMDASGKNLQLLTEGTVPSRKPIWMRDSTFTQPVVRSKDL